MKEAQDRQMTAQSLRGKLLAAYAYFLEKKELRLAEKVKDLAKKLKRQEFAIAFCGHFSAGKSRMINRLAEENLLPSSPIPTSANLVRVKAGGKAYAKVYFKAAKPRLYLAPYDYGLVKKYCKDGDQIQWIEICQPGLRLPQNTVILDTPGIDSADDAHRVATESAVHLADLVFYVMDYNHVQSELNFMFTKELTEAGKEVYLVINQVDKHSDKELSFASFKSSVTESFASWGVKPAEIFYTSLKEEAHIHNQFPKLQAFLHARLKEKDRLLLKSISSSLQKIFNDFLQRFTEENEQSLAPYREILRELTAEESARLRARYHELSNTCRELEGRLERAEREYDTETEKILNSAYLMPFSTRALAEAYLVSRQKDFKVGFWFAKKKTLAEQKKRLELFFQDMLDRTKSQIDWQMRTYLQAFLEEQKLEDHSLVTKCREFHVRFTDEILAAAVKEGARLSGETVLNYTTGVAGAIKRHAQSLLAELKHEWVRCMQLQNEAVRRDVIEQLAGFQRYIDALEQIEQAALAEQAEKEKIRVLLLHDDGNREDKYNIFVLETEELEVINGNASAVCPEKQFETAPKELNDFGQPVSADVVGVTIRQTAEKLSLVSGWIATVPGFQRLSGELQDKALRLQNRGFTVALFGAFSAGKSSFANALIGERVLPVSPNPTTAAINRIQPVQADFPHGTVCIKLKELQGLLDDVNHALRLFKLQAKTLDEAKALVEKAKANYNQWGAEEKTNYAFLQAFQRGYEEFYSRLGETVIASFAEFHAYVAEEEKSCFVEWIDLYYDCPLTRKGIALVDTPGADSINARHTGVAFEFIKNADAILFVTYYNHAFSKADREFLIQLGRVKNAFQLDKMFFMINAIDLAERQEDREAVISYVRSQLVQYGVQNPQLYPLSSLQALEEKQLGQNGTGSGMMRFEEDFYRFIAFDLANMAIASAQGEPERVLHLVESLLVEANEDARGKQSKKVKIEAERTAFTALLSRQQTSILKERLQQEVDELVYYIKQRVFLRFNDFFKESFHPSVLRDDGRDLKRALSQALSELLAQIGFDLAQELRATTVRLDRFLDKMLLEFQAGLADKSRNLNPALSFSLFESKNKTQMEFVPALQDLDASLFSPAMKYFRNPRAFFEQQESRLMRGALSQILDPLADAYLKEEQVRLQETYTTFLEKNIRQVLEQIAQQADAFYCGRLAALTGGVSVQKLEEVRAKIKEMLQENVSG